MSLFSFEGNELAASFHFNLLTRQHSQHSSSVCVEVNVLDVTQLGRIHTQQLAAKCSAEANISHRISDDTGLGLGCVWGFLYS